MSSLRVWLCAGFLSVLQPFCKEFQRMVLAAVLTCCLLISNAAFAQAPAVADAYVQAGTASTQNTNFGNNKTLLVQGGTIAYLQFDLNRLPATAVSANVTKATLRKQQSW